MHPDVIGNRMEIAAFFVAFLGLFALATIPVANLLVSPFVPLPLVAIFVRHGFAAGTLSLATAVVILMATTSVPAQVYLLPFVCSAFILGTSARAGLGAVRTIFIGALGLTLLASTLFYGYNVYASVTERLPTTEAVIDALYNPERILESAKKPPETPSARAMDEMFVYMTGQRVSEAATKAQTSPEYSDWYKRHEQTRKFLQKVNKFPIALIFTGAFAYFCLLYVAGRWALARWDVALPDFEGFRTWRLPWYLAWGPIACFALYSYFRLAGNEMGEFAFDTLLLATLIPYIAIAFSIASFWMDRLQFDPILTAMTYAILIGYFQQVAVVAIFDSWLDFRRLERKDEPPPDESPSDGWDDDIDF